ncbi:extracellular matrix protein 2 [Paramormyrops kingsleyae]|uniref:Extracellular matrix protein 2 n=1 Tax=Paramormyrops kingsleyae TaxID=1676925 RepID=A0A3B3QW80_9TELE|nr:extracellular matrix protein 2 [Paramormyrops kingsleyae]
MRRVVLASLVLLACLGLTLTQDASSPPGTSGKRRRGGGGQARRGGRNGPAQQAGPRAPARHGGAPLSHADDGAAVFIDSYRSIQGLESSYNVLPGKTGACQYQGITMFDTAVWSPRPCITCLCSSGEVVCDDFMCPRLSCPFTATPAGDCCPVCMDLAPDSPEISGDSPLPDTPHKTGMNAAPPQTRIRTDEMLKEKEQGEVLPKKDARQKRKRKEKKPEAEKHQKPLAELWNEEEEEQREKEVKETWRVEAGRRQEAVEERKLEVEEENLRDKGRREELEAEERNLLRAMQEVLEAMESREEEEEEDKVWLRGDVFEMPEESHTEEEIPPLPEPEEEVMGGAPSLPAGCTISDTAVTCENAELTSIPPLSLPELKELSLEGNAIMSIPAEAFNGIPNLERINLGKNKLTSAGISPHAFKKLRHLRRLYMGGNLLQQIPEDLPSSLEELKINENKLSGIDDDSLDDLSSLVTLELEGNLLSEANVDPMAFQALKQLAYLRLGRNHFRTIPQGLPQSLLELYLENNLIEEISESALNRTTNLNVVVLRHNKLEESRIAPLAWINHKNLESIDLSHNKLYQVPSFLPGSLVHLVLVGNQIDRIPGYVFAHMNPGIEYLYLSFNKLDGDGIDSTSFFGAYHSLIELFLDHNQLASIPPGISEMRSLHFLRLNDNRIRSFEEESICDPQNDEDSSLVTLRLENNFIDTRKLSPTSFSCIISYSSVVLKPQKVKY